MTKSTKDTQPESTNKRNSTAHDTGADLDRRAVLAKFARTGTYVAPMATLLLLNGNGSAFAMSDE